LFRFCIGLAIGGTIVTVCAFVMELILPAQRMALRAFFNWVGLASAGFITESGNRSTYDYRNLYAVP
jgi:hypothetical protein